MSNNQIKKIFLTGGTGMIGRSVLNNTNKSNYQFLVPDRSVCDLEDFEQIKKVLKDFKPDLIIHSAGKVGGIKENMSNSLNFLLKNLEIGKNLILAAKENQVKNLINLACSCIYPSNINTILEEEMVLKGEFEKTNEGFALAKIISLKLCEYISKENKSYNYKTLIPCNIYGHHDNFDLNSSHLIPAIINKIHKAKKYNESTVEIWGDGRARREFMYVDDLTDAIFFIIKNFEKVPSCLNIGVGIDYSINDYYQVIAREFGYNGKFSHDLSMPTGVHQKLLSNKKFKNIGWSPKFSINEGIKKTLNFYINKVINEV